MKAPHTPGPWEMDEEACYIFAAKGEMTVLQVRGWGYLTGRGTHALALSDEEGEAIQRANGLLAAAAPELLEALEEVVMVSDRATVEYDKARAAIAKAKGEA